MTSTISRKFKGSYGKLLLGLLALNIAPAAMAQDYDRAAEKLISSTRFNQAAKALRSDYDNIIRDLITLTEIESPPYGEEKRAKAYMELLKRDGLSDVKIDQEGNAFGLRRGTGGGPLIVVAAHLDTVFPAGTDVKVRRNGNNLAAPGISDDTSGLAVLLGIIRALDAAKIKTKADILFMGSVGEEGPANLRGVRYLFNQGEFKDRINYFVAIEPGVGGWMLDNGMGSKRYKITFNGPGGHSMANFGIVNPVYAMGDAIVKIGQMKVPATPLTVFNVGVVEGGTSVNSIPVSVSMSIDLRSSGAAELAAEDKQLFAILDSAVAAENAARSTSKGKVSYEIKIISERVPLATPRSAKIIQVSMAASRAFGYTPTFQDGGGDAMVPMSKGIEAVTLGSGFEPVGGHSLTENITLNPDENTRVMSASMAALLLLAEVQ